MDKYDIITHPNPILRRKAKKVKVFDKDFQELIEDMFVIMREAPGVGLAAPQIGISQKVVVVEYADPEKDEEKPKAYVLVNPEIIYHSDETTEDLEGCLSVPGLVGRVERWDAVTVKAQNRFGKSVKIKAEGWLARIFQHEMDHLDGVLYIDKATEVFEPSDEDLENVVD
jgi:peptide deformylase